MSGTSKAASENEKRFYCETLINLIRVLPGGIDQCYEWSDETIETHTRAILKPLKEAILHANELNISFLPFPVKTRFRNYLEVLNNNVSYQLFTELTRLYRIGAKKYPDCINVDITLILNDAGKTLIKERQMHQFLTECQCILGITRTLSLDKRFKSLKEEYVIHRKVVPRTPAWNRYGQDW